MRLEKEGDWIKGNVGRRKAEAESRSEEEDGGKEEGGKMRGRRKEEERKR